MQRVYSQSTGNSEGSTESGVPNMSGMPDLGGMGGMGGFDPSKLEEMMKNLTPEQREQMEAMASNMAKPADKTGVKVEEVD